MLCPRSPVSRCVRPTTVNTTLVISPPCPPTSTVRAQWLHDMRVALEKNHLGWAMWDYQTNFGVVTKINGVTTPDVDVLNALGLHAPRSVKT
jgi:hypothetical protein